jgi:hypothetical protein
MESIKTAYQARDLNQLSGFINKTIAEIQPNPTLKKTALLKIAKFLQVERETVFGFYKFIQITQRS